VLDSAAATASASAVRSPAMEKQRAYEVAMVAEEEKMDAAVAQQAEADSHKRRTKKRLKAMAQTARLHAAAKETRASALRSEADGLQQRADALARLKEAKKSKRSRTSSPSADISSYAGSSSSSASAQVDRVHRGHREAQSTCMVSQVVQCIMLTIHVGRANMFTLLNSKT
jgi:hypothetical protein